MVVGRVTLVHLPYRKHQAQVPRLPKLGCFVAAPHPICIEATSKSTRVLGANFPAYKLSTLPHPTAHSEPGQAQPSQRNQSLHTRSKGQVRRHRQPLVPLKMAAPKMSKNQMRRAKKKEQKKAQPVVSFQNTPHFSHVVRR